MRWLIWFAAGLLLLAGPPYLLRPPEQYTGLILIDGLLLLAWLGMTVIAALYKVFRWLTRPRAQRARHA